MKRDMDLIRIIADILADYDEPISSDDLEVEGHSHEEVAYHCWLLINGGLAIGHEITWPMTRVVVLQHLTWEGHELADE